MSNASATRQPRGFADEAVIAQVVVAVGDQHVEHDASKELCEIVVDVALCTVVGDELCKVEVAGSKLAILPLEKRHGRRKHPPALRQAVEARDTERAVAVGQALQTRLRNAHASPCGQLVHHELPPAHVVPVVMRWELGDPQAFVIDG
jgi:hypothetical protein